MVPLHTVDLRAYTHALLGLNADDMRQLRLNAKLSLDASRLGITEVERFTLLVNEWEEAEAGSGVLHLDRHHIKDLLHGAIIQFEMVDWGVLGTLYLAHRETDTQIAQELAKLLNLHEEG